MWGSGFFIAPGQVLTRAHVVRDYPPFSPVAMVLTDGTPLTGRVRVRYPEPVLDGDVPLPDIAIIDVDDFAGAPLPLAKDYVTIPCVGYYSGFPLDNKFGLERTVEIAGLKRIPPLLGICRGFNDFFDINEGWPLTPRSCYHIGYNHGYKRCGKINTFK